MRELTKDSPLLDFEPMLDKLANSNLGMRAICDEFGVKRTTFITWCHERADLKAAYDAAKAHQIEFLADEIIEIADESSNDYVERLQYNGATPKVEVNGEAINRSRLRVDARKWILSKLAPKKYGEFERVEMSGQVAVDATVRRQAMELSELSPELLAQLEAELLKVGAIEASPAA